MAVVEISLVRRTLVEQKLDTLGGNKLIDIPNFAKMLKKPVTLDQDSNLTIGITFDIVVILCNTLFENDFGIVK